MGMLKDTAQTTENSTALGKPEDVHTKEDQVATGHIEVGHNEDCLDKLQATDLASSQEIPARNIHPMKLVMLLRLKFGIGRYEISVRLLPGQATRYNRTDLTHRGFPMYIKFRHQDLCPQRR
jgi:hypothetical protein